MSDEVKFSKDLQKNFDRIGINYSLVVYQFMTRNTEFQKRMMDLILAFLSAWAAKYESGYYTEGEGMYPLGRMAYYMLEACKPSRHGEGLHHRG